MSVTSPYRAPSIYTQTLAPLGYTVAFEGDDGGRAVVGFVHEGRRDTWFVAAAGNASGPTHVAWQAGTREAVDAFHRAALAAGSTDNGPPGPRPQYHAHDYGAFVLDPEGNNVEAVCHAHR